MNKRMNIPSTDVVRHWVAWGPDEDLSQERLEQFEAWLAGEVRKERGPIINVHGNHAAIVPNDAQTHYDFGVADERERIIAILEETSYLGSHNVLIALIKGESE
jgi:hypothetical protein